MIAYPPHAGGHEGMGRHSSPLAGPRAEVIYAGTRRTLKAG